MKQITDNKTSRHSGAIRYKGVSTAGDASLERAAAFHGILLNVIFLFFLTPPGPQAISIAWAAKVSSILDTTQ